MSRMEYTYVYNIYIYNVSFYTRSNTHLTGGDYIGSTTPSLRKLSFTTTTTTNNNNDNHSNSKNSNNTDNSMNSNKNDTSKNEYNNVHIHIHIYIYMQNCLDGVTTTFGTFSIHTFLGIYVSRVFSSIFQRS